MKKHGRLISCIGIGLILSAAILEILACRMLPLVRKMDYARLVTDKEIKAAILFAPLVLVLIVCYLGIGVMLVWTGRHAVGMTMVSSALFAVGLIDMMTEKTVTPLLTISVVLFCCTLSYLLASVTVSASGLIRRSSQ
ncbi:hypothetical protein [Bifidobacterium longum]|uniref:hypothetical protein n=1 Tax=Bifidobacterium longum TaxID=216816 RepID=UPI000984E583|nr:hypothetical protein [Bifidobacterium longum]